MLCIYICVYVVLANPTCMVCKSVLVVVVVRMRPTSHPLLQQTVAKAHSQNAALSILAVLLLCALYRVYWCECTRMLSCHVHTCSAFTHIHAHTGGQCIHAAHTHTHVHTPTHTCAYTHTHVHTPTHTCTHRWAGQQGGACPHFPASHDLR